jgi:hypothetical protein
MANYYYSYNEIKKAFEEYPQSWMPGSLSPFQAPPGDNSSDADSKIYSKEAYRGALNYFDGETVFNPFCKRMGCWNVNLKHRHSIPETKNEHVTKIVELLEEWEQVARRENVLNQSQLKQLDQLIQIWKKKNPIEIQERVYKDSYWYGTVSNEKNEKEKICWSVIEKLRYKIDNGEITDDTDQPDPNDFNLCDACKSKKALSYGWEKNFLRELESGCRAGTHLQDISNIESKIHNKCWRPVKENNFHDIEPWCGCSNLKSGDLLESTPQNLVKSFFILNKVKSIKKDPLLTTDLFIHINYLDGRNQVVNSFRQIGDYENLKNYLLSLPTNQREKEITRKDLGIKERDNPDDEPNLKEQEKQILSYFREHGIESIRLKNNKLVIKYNYGYNYEEEKDINNNRELLQIHYYCQFKGINSLTLKDLEKINANHESDSSKILFYGGIAMALALIIGLIVYLVYRSEKNRPRGYY